MRCLSLILLFILVYSCKEKRDIPVDFYYWKTNTSIGNVEKEYFSALDSKKLYIRFFDVDKEGKQIMPKAKIQRFDPTVLDAVYIPVIFITNRTFSAITDYELTRLVTNVSALTDEISKANGLNAINEIQIDCDWTSSTKDAYFHFLKKLHAVSGKKISCTLRLHQIKFKDKTGIPPVEKGFLMCYATSSPSDTIDLNSILSMDLLRDYIQDINKYPLSFDVALPLYSWAVVTNHLGQFKLINGVMATELSDTACFEKISSVQYRVKQDLFFNNLYINQDFIVRLEEITPELLTEAKAHLSDKINGDYNLVYYHLDSLFLQRFTIDVLK